MRNRFVLNGQLQTCGDSKRATKRKDTWRESVGREYGEIVGYFLDLQVFLYSLGVHKPIVKVRSLGGSHRAPQKIWETRSFLSVSLEN